MRGESCSGESGCDLEIGLQRLARRLSQISVSNWLHSLSFYNYFFFFAIT